MPTPSHSCTYSLKEAARRFTAPLLGIAVLLAVLHGARLLNLLPVPVAADLERTILASKVKLASHTQPTPIVLVGDSSCMMNADALALSRNLGSEVLNLGTFSHLDLSAHAALLRRRLESSTPAPRDILLLLHPSALKRSSSEPGFERFLASRLQGDPILAESPSRHPVEAVLGGAFLRERLLQPWIPSLLRKEFAVAYGTTWNIQRRLDQQSGSLIDPTRFDAESLRGRYEFALGNGLEAASREFRKAVPPNCRLWVGLTPVPESLALPGHADQVAGLQMTLTDWLAPAIGLTNLPTTLPDTLFATATHLNSQGVTTWTETLAREIKQAR